MYGGESVRVTFKAEKKIIGQIIDWLGKDVVFTNATEDSVVAHVTVNENAMLYWALQYGLSVEILAPESLRIKMQEAARGLAEKYE